MFKHHGWLVTLILLIALGGCSQYVEGTEIPAISMLEVGDGNAYDDHYRDKGPLLMMVSSEHELNELVAIVPRQDKVHVQGIGLDTFILLAVFDGERFTNGYRVSITKVIKQQNQLYVYAQFVKPQPNQLLQAGGPRSAFSIVSIERSTLPANQPLSVHLMDDATKQEVLVQEYTVK